jgi:Rrf2 family iron-sulfur cluster assembly transcriptional regulator
MKLTTRGRYAVTAMLDLALHAGTGPVSLSDIAGRQAISLSYLEQLFAKLKRASLVSSSRGPGGGYLPARALDAMSVADIVDAVDERIDATHQLWAELSQRIHDYLSSISLASLAERQHVQQVAHRLEQRRLVGHGEVEAARTGEGLRPAVGGALAGERLIDTLSL